MVGLGNTGILIDHAHKSLGTVIRFYENLFNKLDYRKLRDMSKIERKFKAKTPKHQCYQMQTATESTAWCSSSKDCSSTMKKFFPSFQMRDGNLLHTLSLNHKENVSRSWSYTCTKSRRIDRRVTVVIGTTHPRA